MIVSEETRQKIIDRFETMFATIDQVTLGIPGILRTTIERFSKMRGVEGAASISFFTIFSLPPLLILFVSIGSFYLEVDEIHNLLIQFIKDNIPVTTENLFTLLDQIIAERGSLGIIGLISLVWSGSGFLMTLTANINRAYPMARQRSAIENRIIAFVMIAILIVLLALSSVFSTIFSVITTIDIPFLPFDPSWSGISHLVLIILRFLLFLALFLWVPNTKVRKRAAIWAALFATLAWELTARGFGWYLQTGLDFYNVLYGSLGTLVAFMFWIYLDCLIVVFAAYLGAAIDKHHGARAVKSIPGAN